MKILPKHGESAPRRIHFRMAMNIGFLVSSVLAFALLRSFQLEQISFFVAAPLLILFAARLRDWDYWFQARKDQSTVTAALKSLANDYVLVTDLALPDDGGNLDHFLIGPNGLFVIEVKNYSGYVRCDQDQWAVKTHRIKSLSKQAKRNTIALRRAIAGLYTARATEIPYVVPLLVFANPAARLRLFRPTVAVLRLDKLAEFVRDYAAKRPITREEKQVIVHHLMSLNSTSAEMSDQGNIAKAHLRRVK